MKRVNEYRKLFEATGENTLKELKKKYRDLVKEWHPDKFQAGDEKADEAAIKSKKIIEAYHFLVSIAPETKEANKEAYNLTINKAGIEDFHHKGMLLEVSFLDGTTYEYFGVNEKLFLQFAHSDKPLRFGKRKIFNSFLYRKSKKDTDKV